MAEKLLQSTYPLAPAAAHARSSDTEAGGAAAMELRKKKRRKRIIFITTFVISNLLINTIMALTILKARNPSFRIREATVAAFNAGAPANATLNLQFAVKNTNFGRYNYCNTTVVFMHGGTPAGEVHVANSKVGWRSMKKFNVEVKLNLGINPLLRDGVIPIRVWEN
ncbi:hypothetical protein ACS0TY_004672 [Phlomoides rotata]